MEEHPPARATAFAISWGVAEGFNSRILSSPIFCNLATLTLGLSAKVVDRLLASLLASFSLLGSDTLRIAAPVWATSYLKGPIPKAAREIRCFSSARTAALSSPSTVMVTAAVFGAFLFFPFFPPCLGGAGGKEFILGAACPPC